MWHAWESTEKCTLFGGGGSPKEGDHSEDRGVDARMGSEWILGGGGSGFSWLRIGIGGGFL
jgi:hypothetical protein